MEILMYSILGIAVIALVTWTITANLRDRDDLTRKLNEDFPKHEKHKEADDPDDLKGD